MWNIDTGDCVKVLTEHAASVRVGNLDTWLVLVENKMFYSENGPTVVCVILQKWIVQVSQADSWKEGYKFSFI